MSSRDLPPAFIIENKEKTCLKCINCPCCRNKKANLIDYMGRDTNSRSSLLSSVNVRFDCLYCLKKYSVSEKIISEEIDEIKEKAEAKQKEKEIEKKTDEKAHISLLQTALEDEKEKLIAHYKKKLLTITYEEYKQILQKIRDLDIKLSNLDSDL